MSPFPKGRTGHKRAQQGMMGPKNQSNTKTFQEKCPILQFVSGLWGSWWHACCFSKENKRWSHDSCCGTHDVTQILNSCMMGSWWWVLLDEVILFFRKTIKYRWFLDQITCIVRTTSVSQCTFTVYEGGELACGSERVGQSTVPLWML